MMAILLDRHLQSVANYLILSLALADLLVAVLVMPLGAVNEVGQSNIVHSTSPQYNQPGGDIPILTHFDQPFPLGSI